MLARGTRTWVQDSPLGSAWRYEYAMYCLGNNLAHVAAYLLGLDRARDDFDRAPTVIRVSPNRSRIYG